MLKTFVLVIAAVTSFAATPAKAQSIGALLDLVVSTSAPADRAVSGRGCYYARGLALAACRLQAVQQVSANVSRFQSRVAVDRQRTQQRIQQATFARAAAPVVDRARLVSACSWSDMDACQRLSLTPARAMKLLVQGKAGLAPVTAVATQSITTDSSAASVIAM